MKKITIDFSLCKHPLDLHKELKEKLNFPEWSGNNLDALWDMLTGFIETPIDITLIFKSETSASQNVKDIVLQIAEIFEEATKTEVEISFKAIM